MVLCCSYHRRHVVITLCCLLLQQLPRPGLGQFSSFFCPAPSDASQQVWPFPVNTSSVCSQLQLDQPNNAVACSAFALLESLLIGPSGNEVICNIGNRTIQQLWLPKDTDKQGRPLPQVLPDLRAAASGGRNAQLPAVLPAAVLTGEGGTFNWLYKTLTMFARWAPCDALGTPTPWMLPHGWRLAKLANITGDLSQDGLPANTSLPMLAVLKRQRRRSRWWRKTGSLQRPADGQLIVLIRGTLTTFERGIDFNYNMARDAIYGAGLMHQGFKSIADQLWDAGLQQALDEEVLRGGGGDGSCEHVTFTGHSLGGGVATLLAARAQRYLAARHQQLTGRAGTEQAAARAPGRPPLLVTAVLFAAPNAGDAEFVRDYNERVNGRTIEFAHDLVSQIPCKPATTACPNAPTPTANPDGTWPYDRVGGVLRFSGQSMPLQTDAWRRLAAYNQADFCASADSLRWLNQAAHLCSYLCKTSEFVDDSENWCLLWPSAASPGFRPDDTTRATHCMVRSGRNEFPTTPLFPAVLNGGAG